MTLPSDDLFTCYRWMLALIVGIYSLIHIVRQVMRWLRWFAGTREGAIVGKYMLIQILRLKFRRFASEMAQIVALLGILTGVVYWHWMLG